MLILLILVQFVVTCRELLLILAERGDKYKMLQLVANILRIDLPGNIHSHLTVYYCSNVSSIIRFCLSTLIS